MRKQFVKSVTKLMAEDPDRVLLLGDIGVFGFRQAAADFPGRVINAGILEQSTVGMAAGLSIAGMKPIVHTIAPFLVERAYEQLKVDFGYQHLSGTFVSAGGSYDYAALGCTHHCPGDVSLLSNIGFSIFVPGHPDELDMVFERTKGWRSLPIYIRLSEQSNTAPYAKDLLSYTVRVGDPDYPTVFAVGPCLDMVLEAAKDIPVTVVYTVTVKPNDYNYRVESRNDTVIFVEPYNSSQLSNWVATRKSTRNRKINAVNFCLPRRFVEQYGSQNDLYNYVGFNAKGLKKEIEKWTP